MSPQLAASPDWMPGTGAGHDDGKFFRRRGVASHPGRHPYDMVGFNGEVLVTVPSRESVVVRFGLTRNDLKSVAWDLSPLVNAFAETEGDGG